MSWFNPATPWAVSLILVGTIALVLSGAGGRALKLIMSAWLNGNICWKNCRKVCRFRGPHVPC